MTKTKRGIYLILKESRYVYKLNEYSFYFSSMLYMKKFDEELPNYIKMETAKIESNYNCKIDLTELFYLSLYKKIEKRGFYIEYEDIPFDLKDVDFSVQINFNKEG